MHPSTSASSSLDWPEWVPECLQPAIAIANDIPYHHEEEPDDEDEPYQDQQEADPDAEEEDDDDEEDEEEHHGHAEIYLSQHHLQHGHHGLGLGRSRQEHGQPRTGGSVLCIACREVYCPRRGGGTCRECYEEASETESALKSKIEELNARIAFLRTWAPQAMLDDFSDIVLESSDGSKIRAHRAVLISRSSVFKAMLESEMEERRSGVIKIVDFSYEVLRLFVHYLYTAEIHPESLESCSFDLLALAEKYNVKHLKSVCEHFMVSKVNGHNALCNFEYASQLGAKVLKEAALSTILENIVELPKKEEYQDLVNRDAKLVVEIFESYITKVVAAKRPSS